MVATPLNLAHHPTHVVLGTLAARSIGSTAAIENLKKHAWYYGITTDFCRCNKSFVFANSETETCKESCILHFPTTPPCSTTVDVLETGDVPILFSFPQMRKLGVTVELNPEGDKITCPAFGLFSSPAEYSTVGHIVLDLTSLTHQPTTKSREQSGHPERHVVLAMSQGTPAYPAHALDRREDEYEDDKPLVRPTTRKEPHEEGRDQAIADEDFAPLVPPKPSRPPQAADRIQLYWNKRCQGTRASDPRRKAEGEALRNIINKLSDERNLKDLHQTQPYVHGAVQEEDHSFGDSWKKI